MNKKLLSLLLALVMVFSFIPAFAAEEAPKAEDKKMEEAKPAEEKKAEEVAEPAKAEEKPEYVQFLQDNGFVKGDKNGNLMLDKNLTRAEFTALLARLDGKDDVAKAMQQLGGRFTDVTEAHWAKGYISYATGRGWVQGYPNGTFMPEANISYAEIATVLVRYLDVDTNGFNWPVDFIAKAFDLGLMKGLGEIKDYKQAALRKDMFLMLYNTLSNRDFGKFAKYDMIVLENSRTNALKDNTIKAEVLSVVQRPNNVDERGVAKIGDQKVFELVKDEKVLGDSENLLGKVIRATVDGDKLVKVEVNKDYEYKYGNLNKADDKYLVINGEKFSVRIDERYYRNPNRRYDNDDRMFRTYLTDDRRAENYNYREFARQFGKKIAPNFVRATIKDGMVMFVDAFAMKDVAPVADVKRDGKDVYFYNDMRNGSVDRMTPASHVIGYTAEKGFYNMDKKDIKKDDVIHMLAGVTLVRQDAKVEGKLTGTYVNRDGEFATIEKDDYFLSSAVDVKAPLRSVYAYDDQHYRTTQNRGDINGMIKSDVKALLDISGNIQLITSHNKYTDTVGMVKKFNSNYPVFYAANGEKEYNLDVVRETKVFPFGKYQTGAAVEPNIELNDIVYTTDAGEGKAGIIARIAVGSSIKGEAKKVVFADRYGRYFDLAIDLHPSDENNAYVLNKEGKPENHEKAVKAGLYRKDPVRYNEDTRVFAFNADGEFVPANMEYIIKNNSKNEKLQAWVYSEKEFKEFIEKTLKLGRYNYYADREDLAKIVVFYNVEGPEQETRANSGRLVRVNNYASSVEIEVQRGVVETFELVSDRDSNYLSSLPLGTFVSFREFKEVKEGENRKAVKFNEVKPTVFGRVEYAKYDKISVKGTEYWQSKYTKVYGNYGDRYAYVYATGNEADVIIYTDSDMDAKAEEAKKKAEEEAAKKKAEDEAKNPLTYEQKQKVNEAKKLLEELQKDVKEATKEKADVDKAAKALEAKIAALESDANLKERSEVKELRAEFDKLVKENGLTK